MKKYTAFLTAFVCLMTAVSCGKQQDDAQQSDAGQSSAVIALTPAEPAVLTNKMTQQELDRVNKHALTLLDAPSEQHTVSMEITTVDPEEQLRFLEEMKANGEIPQKDYDKARAETEAARDAGERIEYPLFTLIDGCYYNGFVPDLDYDGGALSYSETVADTDENGEPIPDGNGGFLSHLETREFDNAEEYIGSLETESLKKQARIVIDSILNKTYQILPEGTVDIDNMPADFWLDPLDDQRGVWEYDRAAVEAIKDSIDEYSIYDEEMKTEFLVHVTLPPDYDPDKTYPVILLTDGVWRFGNVPELRKCMENGEAAPVLLATLGYNYHIDGTNEYFRFTHLVEQRDLLTDFITDNLMPYLCEQYHIDCANSTLYGHSDGGVFVHNALFHSDRYENQPFGRYLIGSPAFFGLYDEDYDDLRPEEMLKDYDYFERNDTLNKRVWLVGGAQEDPDYKDLYRGHDTTLEGLAHLRDRIDAHSDDYFYKLYESHHYQYIPELLTEYLKAEYPA